jgi:hypothetical protein
VQLVARAEKVLETDVQRAVVIDAEGSTFDLLDSFAAAKRVLITPLKPSRVPDCRKPRSLRLASHNLCERWGAGGEAASG